MYRRNLTLPSIQSQFYFMWVHSWEWFSSSMLIFFIIFCIFLVATSDALTWAALACYNTTIFLILFLFFRGSLLKAKINGVRDNDIENANFCEVCKISLQKTKSQSQDAQILPKNHIQE